MNGFDEEKEVLKELWNDECHEQVFGRTGSGKTVFLAKKVFKLIEKGDSFVCSTPRDDVLRKTSEAAKESGYNVIMIPLDENIGNKKTFNFTTFIKTIDKESHDKAVELIDRCMNRLIPECKDTKEVYWRNTGQNLGFTALLSLLELNPDHFSLPSAFSLVSEAKRRYRTENGSVPCLQEFMKMLDANSSARLLAQSFLENAEETSGCVQSQFLDFTGFCVKSKGLMRAFTRDGFDIAEEIRDEDKPFAVYICLSETATPKFYQIASILIDQMLCHLFSLAERNGGSLNRPVRFVLDEFATISRSFPDFPKMISICRARNIWFTYALQSVNQLNANFSADEVETINDNTHSFVYFATNDLKTNKYLSEKCGERKIDFGNHTEMIPLISANEISALPIGKALVLIRGGLKKAVVKFPYDDQKFQRYSSVSPEEIEDNREPDLFNFRAFFESKNKKESNDLENVVKNELVRKLLSDEATHVKRGNPSIFKCKYVVNVLDFDKNNPKLLKTLSDQVSMHPGLLLKMLKERRFIVFSKEVAEKAVEIIEANGGTAYVSVEE